MSILPRRNSTRIGFTNISLTKKALASFVLRTRTLHLQCVSFVSFGWIDWLMYCQQELILAARPHQDKTASSS